MKINIDGLEVLWPYEYIYPEQLKCTWTASERVRSTFIRTAPASALCDCHLAIG
jgi:hypothetical protein